MRRGTGPRPTTRRHRYLIKRLEEDYKAGPRPTTRRPRYLIKRLEEDDKDRPSPYGVAAPVFGPGKCTLFSTKDFVTSASVAR